MNTRSRISATRENGEAGERSLGELVKELAGESSTLVRQEIALARAELKQNVRELARDAARLSVGGGIAVGGALSLVAFLVALLGELMGDRYWLSALIVGLALAGAGAWLARSALRDMRTVSAAPRETIETLRTTQRWAREEVAELRAGVAGEPRGDGAGRDDGATARLRPPHVAAALSAPATAPGRAAGRRAAGGRTGAAAGAAAGAAGPAVRGLLRRVWAEIKADDVPGEAAKVAYNAFLALPPAILVLFALTGFFGGTRTADWITTRLQGALPPEASNLIRDFVQQIVHQNAPGPLSIGLLLALWASSNVFMALGDALNTAYDVEDSRSWVKRRLMAVGVMIAGVVLMLAGSVLIVGGPQIARALDLFGAAELLWSLVQWPLAFVFVAGAFWMIYYVLPDRDQSAHRKTLVKAALAAAFLWVAASAGFRLYVTNFGSYSESYGILGAMIVLLLWLWVTGLVTLAGGELASEMEEPA